MISDAAARRRIQAATPGGVGAQELNLTNFEKDSVVHYIQWNAKEEENKSGTASITIATIQRTRRWCVTFSTRDC